MLLLHFRRKFGAAVVDACDEDGDDVSASSADDAFDAAGAYAASDDNNVDGGELLDERFVDQSIRHH